jgi:hypothetical protein
MVAFGFVDNSVLVIAGDAIDNNVGRALGLASLASAALAQCLSDTCGVLIGGAVAGAVAWIGYPEPTLTAAQRGMRLVQVTGTVGATLGVLLGCSIGMCNLLFLDPEKEEKEDVLSNIFQAVIKAAPRTFESERATLWFVDPHAREVWTLHATGLKDRIVVR